MLMNNLTLIIGAISTKKWVFLALGVQTDQPSLVFIGAGGKLDRIILFRDLYLHICTT